MQNRKDTDTPYFPRSFHGCSSLVLRFKSEERAKNERRTSEERREHLLPNGGSLTKGKIVKTIGLEVGLMTDFCLAIEAITN